jgi:hypothetical protein
MHADEITLPADLVFAFAFGPIKGFVGSFEGGTEIGVAVIEQGDSQADGESPDSFRGEVLDEPADFFGDLQGSVRPGVGQNEEEFVAAPAEEAVGYANRFPDGFPDGREGGIARQVPVGVVDGFEASRSSMTTESGSP